MKEYQLVLERMKELEGWAEYIVDALHLDQKYEPVRRDMLRRTLEERDLRAIRELSWSLRTKLHTVNTQLELSPSLRQDAASTGD